MVDVEIKLLNQNCLPTKKNGDAGWDLKSAKTMTIPPGEMALVPLGIATSFSSDWAADIRGRSGMDKGEFNARLGLIDSTYRGEWMANIKNNSQYPLYIAEGDRVAQVKFVHVPMTNWIVVDELNETDRGIGGFGSTGLQ